jgi:hypothetical protein
MIQTRLKVSIGVIILIFVEAVLKHFLPGLPFAEAIGAQVVVAGWYVDKENKRNIAAMQNGGTK